MVLAAPVIDDSGQVLLPVGHTITDPHIALFKTRGIAEADVADACDVTGIESETVELNPELLAAALEIADELFKFHNLTFATSKSLFQMFIVDEVKRLAEKTASK